MKRTMPDPGKLRSSGIIGLVLCFVFYGYLLGFGAHVPGQLNARNIQLDAFSAGRAVNHCAVVFETILQESEVLDDTEENDVRKNAFEKDLASAIPDDYRALDQSCKVPLITVFQGLFNRSGSCPLYVLYHSWKGFL